jgi:hypothetical protein
MPRLVPSPGAEFATRCSMAGSVLTRIRRTLTPMERILRLSMKTHSYSIVVPLVTIPGEDCLRLNLWTPILEW